MSDLISRSALKTAFEEDGHLSAYIEEYIDDAPAVKASPVVLCQDCKHRGKLYECPMRKIIHIEGEGGSVLDLSKDDGFCDRGEARERDEH